jgi:secondary thiamine-phosphate synthase enzyme
MKIATDTVRLSTKGHTDVIDITEKISAALQKSNVESGIATLFVIGSTAALTTIEFEPGLVHDIKVAFEKIAPANGQYRHHEKWGDDNGNSHVRASLLGPSLTIPFNKGKLTLGTWQQIILIDFDTQGRQREVVVQIMGV